MMQVTTERVCKWPNQLLGGVIDENKIRNKLRIVPEPFCAI